MTEKYVSINWELHLTSPYEWQESKPLVCNPRFINKKLDWRCRVAGPPTCIPVWDVVSQEDT